MICNYVVTTTWFGLHNSRVTERPIPRGHAHFALCPFSRALTAHPYVPTLNPWTGQLVAGQQLVVKSPGEPGHAVKIPYIWFIWR